LRANRPSAPMLKFKLILVSNEVTSARKNMKIKRKLEKTIKAYVNRFLFLPAIFVKVFSRKSYFRKTGWLVSIRRGHPCDADGSPSPWMNYSIIALLSSRLNKSHSVFEYGAGNSSLFFSSLVKEVFSVEHDEDWISFLNKNKPSNLIILHKSLNLRDEYVGSAASVGKKFNLIVVDGRKRVDCVISAMQALTDDGCIVLDDTQRQRYLTALEFALPRGFRCLEIEGLKPMSKLLHKTIMYRPHNCLGI